MGGFVFFPWVFHWGGFLIHPCFFPPPTVQTFHDDFVGMVLFCPFESV